LILPAVITRPRESAIEPAAEQTDSWSGDMSPQTLAIMRRQEKLEPALKILGDEHVQDQSSGYAGIAFEGDGLTLYWKGELTPGMAASVDNARAIGNVSVKQAKYSEAELKAAGASINQQIKALGATDIQTIGYPADGSGLHIELQPDATRQSWAAARIKHGKPAIVSAPELVARAGVTVPVTFSVASAPMTKTVDRYHDSPAWNGGGVWYNVSKGLRCTTGFGVHGYGSSFVLTAAHCASNGDDIELSSTDLGNIVYIDDWRSDILLLNTPGWHVIFDGGPTTSTTKSVLNWGFWAQNELVCQSGTTSGTVCNIKEIDSEDISWPQDHPDSDGDWGYTVYGEIRGDQMDGYPGSRGGDSGAPVFTLNGSGVTAKGIDSASGDPNHMFFQDWGTIGLDLGVYPNVANDYQ
jgi:hypothetical protein